MRSFKTEFIRNGKRSSGFLKMFNFEIDTICRRIPKIVQRIPIFTQLPLMLTSYITMVHLSKLRNASWFFKRIQKTIFFEHLLCVKECFSWSMYNVGKQVKVADNNELMSLLSFLNEFSDYWTRVLLVLKKEDSDH